MNNYTHILREHNLKVTPQRLAITDALYLSGHITIDALYELMIKKFNSISLATIYKNINLMLENSLVKEIKIPNAKSVYEIIKETHSHLVCSKCSKVEDITLDFNTIITEISTTNKFQIDSTDFVISGVCESCNNK